MLGSMRHKDLLTLTLASVQPKPGLKVYNTVFVQESPRLSPKKCIIFNRVEMPFFIQSELTQDTDKRVNNKIGTAHTKIEAERVLSDIGNPPESVL